MNWFENLNPVIQALIASIFTWGVTALGSLVVCFFKEVNKKILNTILGFSAGVMIASSFWSLLAPSIELSGELGYIAWALPAIGFSIGAMFVLLSDKFLDRALKNKEDLRGSASLKKSILLISAITIHGRTRAQYYSGTADLEIIKKVKESVNIPVIGNGDVVDEESAKEMFEKTGVDGIMIGRASMGNPWIFKKIKYYAEYCPYKK